jgi:hypothetical protein
LAENKLLSIFMEAWESYMDDKLLSNEFKWILEMNFFLGLWESHKLDESLDNGPKWLNIHILHGGQKGVWMPWMFPYKNKLLA